MVFDLVLLLCKKTTTGRGSTLEMGERITGIPAAQIRQIAETMAKADGGCAWAACARQDECAAACDSKMSQWNT